MPAALHRDGGSAISRRFGSRHEARARRSARAGVCAPSSTSASRWHVGVGVQPRRTASRHSCAAPAAPAFNPPSPRIDTICHLQSRAGSCGLLQPERVRAASGRASRRATSSTFSVLPPRAACPPQRARRQAKRFPIASGRRHARRPCPRRAPARAAAIDLPPNGVMAVGGGDEEERSSPPPSVGEYMRVLGPGCDLDGERARAPPQVAHRRRRRRSKSAGASRAQRKRRRAASSISPPSARRTPSSSSGRTGTERAAAAA